MIISREHLSYRLITCYHFVTILLQCLITCYHFVTILLQCLITCYHFVTILLQCLITCYHFVTILLQCLITCYHFVTILLQCLITCYHFVTILLPFSNNCTDNQRQVLKSLPRKLTDLRQQLQIWLKDLVETGHSEIRKEVALQYSKNFLNVAESLSIDLPTSGADTDLVKLVSSQGYIFLEICWNIF